MKFDVVPDKRNRAQFFTNQGFYWLTSLIHDSALQFNVESKQSARNDFIRQFSMPIFLSADGKMS
jgi:hypothetical protein